MKQIKNKNGSVLTTTVIILMIVLILTGVMYSIAWLYFMQSIENNEQRQAYLYAKSECDVIAKYFINYGNDPNNLDDNPYSFSLEDKKIDTFPITLKNNSSKATTNRVAAITKNVGKVWCSKHEDDKNYVVTIEVTVTYHKQSSTVSLTVNNQNNNWTKGYYS